MAGARVGWIVSNMFVVAGARVGWIISNMFVGQQALGFYVLLWHINELSHLS